MTKLKQSKLFCYLTDLEKMAQIQGLIFVTFSKEKHFHIFGYQFSDIITISNVNEHLRHQRRNNSCPMGGMVTNDYFFEEVLSNAVIMVY